MKIGTMEILVILLIAYLVLGPERTVQYTKKLGQMLRTLRIYINSFTEDITESVTEPLQELQKPLEELKKPFEEMQKPLEEAMDLVRQPMDELQQTVRASDAKLKAPLDLKAPAQDGQAPAAETEELEEAVPLESE